jgi:uncharacterized membrane protein YidH (DUF202 family)
VVSKHKMIVGYVLLTLGAILILTGIGLTVWQFTVVTHVAAPAFPQRDITVSRNGLAVNTTYIGVILIAFGVLTALSSALFRDQKASRISN